MAQMTGADIGDLESGAARLESVGSQIGGMRRPLRSQLYSSHWEGRAAERFRNRWDTVHGPALSDAEAFLHSAGRLLRAEADQQRRASNMDGGGGSPSFTATSGSESTDALAEIRDLLESLNLPVSEINKLLERLGLLNELGMLAGPLKALAENKALKDAFSIAGKALDFATLIVDFVTTVADNPELPMDEAIVLAGATIAVGLAAGAGVKVASKAIGGVVAGAFSGGTATVVGVLVGEVVGVALNKAFDVADDQFNITENIAQGTLDAYRFAKERDFDAQRIAFDGVGMIADNIVGGAQNIIGDLGEMADDGINRFVGWAN